MNLREERIANLVIGSGAAGFSAAIRLASAGEEVALITESVNSGTSRNTGSDKQTYYKLSLAAGDADSVRAMAEDLFAGGCVDGDNALCEAALSARSFYRLAELGVAFPDNEYGEFMGYKTDHDRGRRATSAGPYTSKQMTEVLEAEAKRLSVPVIDRCQAIRVLVKDGEVRGVLCLDLAETEWSGEVSFAAFYAENVILATGGPAGMYKDSVYPGSQLGASGMAFAAGAAGKNLTEWQFGMASLRPRWNVSGTYMQVLPRFVSTDAEGGDEREFLREYYTEEGAMLSAVFLKGYQWPFDAAKAENGSSVIDLAVYRETVLRGRRVWLDYTANAGGGEVDFEALSPEALDYLRQAGACFGTPFERLQKMNAAAVDFYREHGVDLETEKLEIAVCVQHNNGGLAVDGCWETAIRGLFAVGELAGTHGVTRPGGTALNAGQCGAYRAAERIRLRHAAGERREAWQEAGLSAEDEAFAECYAQASGEASVQSLFREAAARMSEAAGIFKDAEKIDAQIAWADDLLAHLPERAAKPGPAGVGLYFRLIDMVTAQKVYLSAIRDYRAKGGRSRGSALYPAPDGVLPAGLPETFRFAAPDGGLRDVTQEVRLLPDGTVACSWRPVRPLPEPDYFFENAWRAYKERNAESRRS